ncbi:hypothetical protein QJQ45_022653 [Haematococcus lacustris]|nr:hypothetical protein QJQ45_022653 [Haematococcus lacustris]
MLQAMIVLPTSPCIMAHIMGPASFDCSLPAPDRGHREQGPVIGWRKAAGSGRKQRDIKTSASRHFEAVATKSRSRQKRGRPGTGGSDGSSSDEDTWGDWFGPFDSAGAGNGSGLPPWGGSGSGKGSGSGSGNNGWPRYFSSWDGGYSEGAYPMDRAIYECLWNTRAWLRLSKVITIITIIVITIITIIVIIIIIILIIINCL